MTPEQRKLEEEQIKNNFSELQKKLADLKNEVQSESDDSKKQEKNEEIQKLEKELSEMKTLIDTLSSLQEADLQSLKTRLESTKKTYQEFSWEVADLQNEKTPTPTTYELLKDSETCNRLRSIIESNPNEFKNVPWETSEKKLEYIFEKIRDNIVQFLNNKLWKSENAEKVINNTIAPAFEWNLMEMLRNQWNETNVGMLQWMDGISWDSLWKLVDGVTWFANNFSSSYSKFNQWMNAIDYLSVHNWVINNPSQSEVLSNPLKFKEYMNDAKFAAKEFSPYEVMSDNVFKIDENQTFEFGMSLQEKQSVLSQIWNIQVTNNPRTTALIVKMLDKSEDFLKITPKLQETANGLLDWVFAINSVTKIFGKDIIWEISKLPEERSFWFKIMDFVCKLIWITWGLEWIVKKWRLDRLNLTEEKNHSISEIFKEYQKIAGKWGDISITDSNSCSNALSEFNLSDLDKQSTTKGDYLRDVMTEKMSLKLLSPSAVKETIWEEYLKKEIIMVDWKKQEKISVDESKITNDKKKEIAHKHIMNMKNYLSSNFDDLKDFYSNIHNTDDLVVCITTALYANKDDVVEWVKAKVFLPENYGVVSGWKIEGGATGTSETTSLSDLTQSEQEEMQNLVEQSKTPNTINYLENATYKKYLNVIEKNLSLPRHSLEAVCFQESRWKLYNWGNIIGSSAWAQWLFQFMPWTADTYMKHAKLQEKYWKTFTSRTEFLKDPLASAWAAWIMYSEFMTGQNYNFQSALACYNRWIGNYQKKIWGKWTNLSASNFARLPAETKKYVENITKNILQNNSDSSTDILLADLWKYSRGDWWTDNIEYNNEFLIWPRLLAHNKDEIWWLGNSIMNWFQWGNWKSEFPNMDGAVWKNTRNHPAVKDLSDNQIKEKFKQYKLDHPEIKSFMFYFGANNNNNQQTISDIKKRSERLQEVWIQPVLTTCIWENSTKTPRLKELNQKMIALWKEKNRPVLDFAKSYSKWDVAMSADWVHPTSYSPMSDIISGQLSQA